MTFTPEKYHSRTPEKLVLESYRQWTLGMITRQTHHWDEAWNLLARTLGTRDARLAMNAMVRFMKTLSLCAGCPLKVHKPQSEQMCRDEVLVLGLIAGIQYGDDRAITFCLDELSCSSRCVEVEQAASEFAFVLRALNHMLVPIPHEILLELSLQSRPTPSTAIH